MKEILVSSVFVFHLLFSGCGNTSAPADTIKAVSSKESLAGHIQHTVMFNLKHESNSPEEKYFLEQSRNILSAIPGVKKFEVKRQISGQNSYSFYFSMYFSDPSDFEKYNAHPDHVEFVKEIWDSEVSEFMEADFIDYP